MNFGVTRGADSIFDSASPELEEFEPVRQRFTNTHCALLINLIVE